MTTYIPPATAKLFHDSTKKVRLAFGPVGTGKSVTTQIEVIKLASLQAKNTNKKRCSRWGVFRNTYPELKSTTLKTWADWFPEQYFGKIKWDSPITQTIHIKDWNVEVLFIALDGLADIGKIKSLELTGALINELQFFPLAIFNLIQERINRYPPKKDGAKITRACLIADTNPPSSGHWIYKRFEEQLPKNHAIFKYPPALLKATKDCSQSIQSAISLNGTRWINNPEADYRWVQNDQNYWLDLVAGYTDEDIRVTLCGEYGVTKLGKPVYPEYNDQLHCQSLNGMSNLEIGLGWDFGLTPAVVITQISARGQLCIIDELVAQDMGIKQFTEKVVLPYLNKNYPWWDKKYRSICDPAGSQRAQTDESTCMEVLLEAGINTSRASTQSPVARREAVAYFLTNLVDGRPTLMIDKRCTVLRNGFLGEYHYKQMRIVSQELYKEEPEKNASSHPHDGLQYIALYYYNMFKHGGRRETPCLSKRVF